MGSALILTPHVLTGRTLSEIGGKARGLWHIHRAGLRAPEWRVLPYACVATRAWRGDAALREALLAVFEESGRHVAVRSSSEAEDAAGSSNAGQFLTVFAATEVALFAALDEVAASARGSRMAIVVQRALTPVCAGVLFSAEPSAARPDMLYLEAVRGHGRQLVDGEVSPARVWMGLDGALVRAVPGGCAVEDIAAHVASLADGLLVLEAEFGAAVDIEWAVSSEELYFLQARPLTALEADPALRPAACHTSWFFDQRFLQPISPFTRSTLVPLILRASIGEAIAMRGGVYSGGEAYFGGQAYVPHAAYRRALDGAPRWFLSPDLRQIFPARCGCGEVAPTATVFGYAWDALRSVVREWCEVFLNVRAWDTFRNALPGRIVAAQAGADFAARWRALDELTLAFLRVHRWSILWADYFFRMYGVFASIVGPLRADAALRRGLRFATAEANAALAHARAADSRAAWEALAETYGQRSASLDYAAPTWGEIYAAESTGSGDAVHTTATPRARDVPPGGNAALAWLLAPVRRLLEMREEQRLNWERILAVQRGLALSLARGWAAQGALADAEDIWLLTWDEARAAVEGASLPTRGALVARQHALRVEALVPKPLFIGGAAMDPEQHAGAGGLSGLGASAGRARGVVIHLHDPARGLPAGAPRPCILVVRALDPAHTELLRQAAGVIAERGGLLSHAAILAREYRTPLITAAEGAFARLPEGAEVEMDGQSGRVTVIGGA